MRKAQKWTILALICAANSFAWAAPAAAYGYGNGNKNGNSTPQNGTKPNGTKPQQQQPPKMSDCTQLSSDEQDFADELNPTNKMIFCNKFSSSQRNSAMDISGTMGKDGKLMTNDQAVEKVARDNNMMMPNKPSQTRPGGSCPVK